MIDPSGFSNLPAVLGRFRVPKLLWTPIKTGRRSVAPDHLAGLMHAFPRGTGSRRGLLAAFAGGAIPANDGLPLCRRRFAGWIARRFGVLKLIPAA